MVLSVERDKADGTVREVREVDAIGWRNDDT